MVLWLVCLAIGSLSVRMLLLKSLDSSLTDRDLAAQYYIPRSRVVDMRNAALAELRHPVIAGLLLAAAAGRLGVADVLDRMTDDAMRYRAAESARRFGLHVPDRYLRYPPPPPEDDPDEEPAAPKD